MEKLLKITGLFGAGRAWQISKLLNKESAPVKCLIITRDNLSAEELYNDICLFSDGISVLKLPSWDTLPFENVSPQTEISAERIQALLTLAESENYVCIVTADSLTQNIIEPDIYRQLSVSLYHNTDITRENLISKLTQSGYHRVTLVEHVGEFAVRGNVVDVFPADLNTGIRIELNPSNKSLQIRSFDTDSQRSIQDIDQIVITPVRELLPMSELFGKHNEETRALINSRALELETPKNEADKIIEKLHAGEYMPGIELYQAIAYNHFTSLDKIISKDTLIILDDLNGIEETLSQHWELISERYERLANKHYLIPSIEKLYNPDCFPALCNRLRPTVYLDPFETFDSKKEEKIKTFNFSFFRRSF